MVNYLDTLFESVVKKAEKKKKLAESKQTIVALKEAKMSEIPHEIDSVIHSLAQIRIDMEHLRDTWSAAGFSDLTPLAEIINGVVDLTNFVYMQGALLADQQIGLKPEPAAPVVAAQETDGSLKEDDSDSAVDFSEMDNLMADAQDSCAQADQLANSIEDVDVSLESAPEPKEECSDIDGKEITLAECEALCANPINANLRKAFKKCCSDFRHNRPEGSNGEIVKIILTPRNNLRLMFDGCDRPAFAYCDGESLI